MCRRGKNQAFFSASFQNSRRKKTQALKKLKAILLQKLKVPELFTSIFSQNSTYRSYFADFGWKLNKSELYIGIDPLSHIPKKLLNLFMVA